MSSDFAVTQEQRRRLLAGDYRPFLLDTKPHGCEVGARYVLSWQQASASAYKSADESEAFVVRIPRCPVWYLTVKSVQRRPDRLWLVRFDVTDVRDRDVFLRPGGGTQQGRDPLKAGALPEWTPSMETRAKAIGEFWHLERLKRHAEERKERGRARIRRAA